MNGLEDYRASPRNLERHLLSAITGLEDLEFLDRVGVTERTFRDPTCRSAFVYIRATLVRTGSIPSDSDLQTFGGIERLVDAADLESAATAVRNHEMALDARDIITTRWSDMEENAPRGIALLVQDLLGLQTKALSHTAHSDAKALDRLADQVTRQERLAAGGVLGIQTGLLTFDSIGAGWSPGELITVMGMTGIGKSWMLIYFGAVAYQAGFKVLFIEPELGRRETEYRIDTVLGRMNGFQFSNKALLKGQYAGDENYEKWLRMFAQNDRWVTADSSDTPTGTFTIEAIVNLVSTHKPHLLMIDGFHLLGSHANLSTWEQIKAAADAIKTLGIRHDMAVIAAMQVQREAMVAAETTPEIYHSAYGKALVEDSQRIISMAKARGNPNLRLYSVIKMTHGEPVAGRRRLHWDVDSGDIHEIQKGEES